MGHLKRQGSSLHLRIAGNEERAGELARARTRLGELALKESCQLVGDVRGETKTRLLDEASLFVLPSYQEGLPIAVLEAMAAGLPVITTPVGGLPEVIKDGYNGFLVPPGAVAVLAEKLALLAANPDLRETMGRRNLEIAQKELDVKPYVNRLVTLYESLAGLA
jgi:glycosyltransferase involved in cell wall biosynthesis